MNDNEIYTRPRTIEDYKRMNDHDLLIAVVVRQDMMNGTVRENREEITQLKSKVNRAEGAIAAIIAGISTVGVLWVML
jgi:hypothetical protein